MYAPPQKDYVAAFGGPPTPPLPQKDGSSGSGTNGNLARRLPYF